MTIVYDHRVGTGRPDPRDPYAMPMSTSMSMSDFFVQSFGNLILADEFVLRIQPFTNFHFNRRSMIPYRRKPTIRKPGYDYSQDGLYFVTSCVKHQICHFGNVENNKMVLNTFGLIAHQRWDWLLNRYPYLASHAFIVMPNHIHGVLEINRSLVYSREGKLGCNEKMDRIPTSELLEQPVKIKPLDQLLGAYKTTSSKLIHLAELQEFQWQRSYHDHIIRAEKSYHRIVEYIRTNPERWEEDRFYR